MAQDTVKKYMFFNMDAYVQQMPEMDTARRNVKIPLFLIFNNIV